MPATKKRNPARGKPKSKPPRVADDQLKRAARIYKALRKTYPDAKCALEHKNAFELLMSTILSAQCTDVRVNMVTPALFKKYPTPAKMAGAPQDDLEELVRTTGFFRNKAKSLKGASQLIMKDHAGDVPDGMDELTALPGVARKTANVVLGNAFGKNEGVVVDTHVARLTNRMGLTRARDPKKIELDLMPLFPRKNWALLSHLLIHHGRNLCPARKPKCDNCPIADDCPKVGVTSKGA